MNGSKGSTNKFVLSMLVLAILAPVPISAEEVQKVTIVAPDGVRLDGRYFSPASPDPRSYC